MLFVSALAANVVVLLQQEQLRLYLSLGSATPPRRRRPSSITLSAATRFFFSFSLLFSFLSSIQGHSLLCVCLQCRGLFGSAYPPHAASCSRCECVLSAGSSTRSCWCKSARPLKDQDGLSGLINGLVARPAAADTVFRRRTGSAGDIPRLLVGSFFFPLFLFLGSPTLFVLIVTAATPPQRWQRRSGAGG